MKVIHLARKPLSEGSVAANVVKHGVGGLNIDATRVGSELRVNPPAGNQAGGESYNMSVLGMPKDADPVVAKGRWPANVILEHLQGCHKGSCAPGCPVAALDADSGATGGAAPVKGTESSPAVAEGGIYSPRGRVASVFHNDKGGASRFYKQIGGEPCE